MTFFSWDIKFLWDSHPKSELEKESQYSYHENTTQKFPHLDFNHGWLELKANVLPMSYTDR